MPELPSELPRCDGESWSHVKVHPTCCDRKLFIPFKRNVRLSLKYSLPLHNLNKVLRIAKVQGESLYCVKGILCQTVRLSQVMGANFFGCSAQT